MNLTIRIYPKITKSTNLTISTITTPSDFLALQSDWHHLSENTSVPSIFSTWDWVENWWKIFLSHRPHQLFIYVFKNTQGEIVGIVPFFCLTPQNTKEKLLHWRELRTFDSKIDNQEAAGEEPVHVISAGYEEAVFCRLQQYFVQQKWASWDQVVYNIVYPEKENPSIKERRLHLGHVSYTKTRPASQVCLLPADWSTFKKTLSRSMRDNLPYYPRLLERHGYNATVRFLMTPEEVREGIEPFIALHKSRADATISLPHHIDHLVSDDAMNFVRHSFPILAKKEQLFIVQLEIENKIIASQAFLAYKNSIIFYYSGFIPEFSKYSPIFIISTHVIQYAILNKMQYINFLPGEYLWKKRWGAEPISYRKETRIHQLKPSACSRMVLAHIKRKRNRKHKP
jgi:CelD/BcsL family acetyltransferase involved in cellulose biosynthesis